MTAGRARPLDLVVIGDGNASARMAAALRRAAITDFVTVAGDEVTTVAGDEVTTVAGDEITTVAGEDAGYSFDADADRWLVRALDGREWRPRVLVLAAGRPLASEPPAFLGVATHGQPNLFFAETDAQARYIVKCLAMLTNTGCTRIEVRAGTQHEFNRRVSAGRAAPGRLRRRALRRPKASHFDLTVPADREPPGAYRGPATLDATGVNLPVSVVLGGYRDPIDGRYHWHGLLRAADPDTALPDPGRATMLLSLPGREAVAARLAERDPWGNLRVTGIGEPPFSLRLAECDIWLSEYQSAQAASAPWRQPVV